MGMVYTIKHDQFPKQGSYLGLEITVCFHYDTEHTVKGVVVRDDIEAPWQTIIRLDDGRFILMSECQYDRTDLELQVWKRGMATTHNE